VTIQVMLRCLSKRFSTTTWTRRVSAGRGQLPSGVHPGQEDVDGDGTGDASIRWYAVLGDANCDALSTAMISPVQRMPRGREPPTCDCLCHCDMNGGGFVNAIDLAFFAAFSVVTGDGKMNDCDNCPAFPTQQADMTPTGVGDACDNCPNSPMPIRPMRTATRWETPATPARTIGPTMWMGRHLRNWTTARRLLIRPGGCDQDGVGDACESPV